jgi:ABC-type polysaccharide/polyol phosphate transport system ATPase subunit
MNDILIVERLSKKYKAYNSEIKRILSWFGFSFKCSSEYNVLNNISFTVSKGKAVGVIGKNGAGKSTLLKLITGTLSSTTGSIKVNGSVAAILELGMGFNPELSGRENAIHSAGLMGKDRKEIHEHIKKIEEFAEIGEHFDEPIRTYSSGMQARLAFSVATAFRPDLLIVDEALSVGDVSFQAKCFQHMLDMKRKGTAILLVSHDSQAIKNFCDEALLLYDGDILNYGEPKSVIQIYEKLMDKYISKDSLVNNAIDSCSLKKVELQSVILLNDEGLEINSIITGNYLTIKYVYKAFENFNDPHYGIRITDRFGISIFETNTYCMEEKSSPLSNKQEVEVFFKVKISLAPGNYNIDTAVVNEGYNGRFFKSYLAMDNMVKSFSVFENNDEKFFGGLVNLSPTVRIQIK